MSRPVLFAAAFLMAACDEGPLALQLDETHKQGMGVPLGADPSLEVRYDPDGVVETKDGSERVWIAVRPA